MIRRETHWLVGLLIVAGMVLVFGMLADEVMEGDTGTFDRRVILLLRVPGDPGRLLGPAWLAEMLRDLTSLGSTVVLGIVTLTIVGYLALAQSWRAVAFVLVSVLGGQFLSTVLKNLFERARPDLVPGAPQVFTASFPSGHAMLSAVTYLTIAALLARIESRPVLKHYYLAVGIGLTILIGVSRVALGVHWPTDVLAGWCVGAAWALLCAWVASRLQARDELEGQASS